jgi:BirA family biotin operon repressor/biotin-[acetyl-CoA-carboxylase] ligase
MQPPPDLTIALEGLALPEVRYYPSVESTNDIAMRWAAHGAPDLALVVADEQTAGRGRAGRRWHTPPGAALAFSLALSPQPDAGQALGRYAPWGALAVCAALEKGWDLQPEIKWPNDVLLSGRKIAGVLAEARWQGERLSGLVLGIGINIHPGSVPAESELDFPATCVSAAATQPVDRWQVLRSGLEALMHWRPRLQEPGFLEAWSRRLAFKDRWVRLTPPSGPPVEGRLLGLDPSGALLVSLASGEQRAFLGGGMRLRPAVEPHAR